MHSVDSDTNFQAHTHIYIYIYICLKTSSDENFGDITLEKNKVKEDTIELVTNQIYDKITMLINNRRKRLGIKGGAKIVEPIRNYDILDLDDNGNLTFKYGKEDIYIGNINEGLNSPSNMIKKLDVNKLKSMGFTDITYKDIKPSKYKKAREEVRKLNLNLGEKSKEIESSSTIDAEAIEMMEMTSKDIDKTVKM